MSSFRWLSPMRGISISALALLITAGVARAQITPSPNTLQANQSSSQSSSRQYLLADSSLDPSTPSAPEPAGGGGQYDNRGGHGGRHGYFSHLAWEAGGGFNAPSGDSSPYITWGGNLTIGAGYRFNPYVSLFAEYQFIDDKLPGRIIAQTGADGGNAHIWSFTLDPVINLTPKSATGVYITGGGGFYRKVTNFTNPNYYEYCDYFYCGIYEDNIVVGHFSSNQGGWSVGGGISHKLGGMYSDGKTQIFAEARYLWINTPTVSTQPNGLGTVGVGPDTRLIPVTFGVRF